MTQRPTIAFPEIGRLERSLRRLDECALEPIPQSDDNPLLVASIGWRNGSTLLQRILMTDPTLMMWGEPMDRAFFGGRLTDALSSVMEDWPETNHWISHRPEVDLNREWVASLTPDSSHLKAALLAFFDTWLAKPARARGFQRWGSKETRWSGPDGMMFRWLYPKSDIVLVLRHPVSAFHSILQYNLRPGWGLWIRWPDHFIDDLDAFAHYWNAMALSWASVADRLGVQIVRYEDLMSGQVDLKLVQSKLGLNLQPDIAMEERVGGNPYVVPMTAEQRDRVNALTAQGRSIFGYQE